MSELRVIVPFGPWLRGDRIRDPATVARVLAGANAHRVLRLLETKAPDKPEAEP